MEHDASGPFEPQRLVARRLLALDDAVLLRACIHAVARFGIADLVHDRPAPIESIAAVLKIDEAALRLTIDVLVEAGIFELRPAGIANTVTSQLLRTQVPGSLRSHFSSLGPTFFAPAIVSVLRSGRAAPEIQHGKDFWRLLEEDPEQMRLFQEKMAEQLHYLDLDRLARLDWVDEVVDVGGGLGALLTPIVRRNNDVRGVVVDLPSVTALGKTRVPTDVRHRIRFEPGDMFVSVPITSGWYLVSRTLHDWDDERAVKLLTVIRSDAGVGARLRVLERLLDAPGGDDGRGPSRSVAMMLLFGGRERTNAELAELIDGAGWRVVRRHYVGNGHAVIDCDPA